MSTACLSMRAPCILKTEFCLSGILPTLLEPGFKVACISHAKGLSMMALCRMKTEFCRSGILPNLLELVFKVAFISNAKGFEPIQSRS